jgi:hypothetical protein
MNGENFNLLIFRHAGLIEALQEAISHANPTDPRLRDRIRIEAAYGDLATFNRELVSRLAFVSGKAEALADLMRGELARTQGGTIDQPMRETMHGR